MVKKQSFLSNLIGENSYNNAVEFAKIAIPIGSLVLLALYCLSCFFYSSIVNFLLKLTTGFSIPFIAYIALWIILLDIKVNVDEPEKKSWEEPKEVPKPLVYKFTIIWTVILVILGICTIYYSNKYRKHYSFGCETFLVDNKSQLYHLEWSECESAENAEQLEEMQGYQIGNSFSLCEECKEIAEEAEAEYESDRYFRR